MLFRSCALAGRRSLEIDQLEHAQESAARVLTRAIQPNSLSNRGGTVLTEAPSHSHHRPYWHARSAARYASLVREHQAGRLRHRPNSAIGNHAGPPYRAGQPARTRPTALLKLRGPASITRFRPTDRPGAGRRLGALSRGISACKAPAWRRDCGPHCCAIL